ncbi:NACHT, LRR and PYD domains-containing protein 3-like isoform X2 [Alosa pseudoharengus]
MEKITTFKGQDASIGPSDQKERSHSPTPSCVSMKSDQSMEKFIKFKGEDPSTGRSDQKERSHSPTPSCVSMKSDQSMEKFIKFKGEDPSTGRSDEKERSHSPTPSCVSMKSDQSMEKFIKFKGEYPSTGRHVPEEGGAASITSLSEEQPTSHGAKRWTPEEAEVHDKLRSILKRKTQHLIEGVPNLGDNRLLHEIYTDLYITEGGGGINDEHEVRQIERSSWSEEAQKRPIKCSDVFNHLPGQDKPIRTVLTKGVAGIGKTVSVQKFILDWAEGKNNQDIHFMFPLPFRELNLMKKRKLSLEDLIQQFFQRIKDLKILTRSEHKCMFIFDGLDECRLPLDFDSNLMCCDVTEPASVDVLLTSLIKGNLLPSALLWITTRPAAASQIPPIFVDQVTEIRGFNDPQKDEYFRRRICDENLANQTITHLKSSRTLYIMCHVAVFCWITATVVERTSEESEKVEIPRTLTQMYTHFLLLQTSIKKEKYIERKETDEEIIFKLGQLAFQQLEKGNLIFYEEDLRECGIDVAEASVYSGVCTQIFREESGMFQGKVFSFVHLSIQEFLAALYVFLCFNNRERKMPDQQETSQLSALFKAATLHDLHKTAVDLALQSWNGHLDLFLRFLLGLSLESNQSLLRHQLSQAGSQSQSSKEAVQYVKQNIRQNTSDRRINLFYCLNELNQHVVVEDVDRRAGTLSVSMLLQGEWKTKEFKFGISEEQLDDFELQKYIDTPEQDLTELLSPDEVLQKLMPVVTASTSALLTDCCLTENTCSVLASAVSSTSCSLKELNLSENKIQDAGVQHLSDLLRNPHCELEALLLTDCSLTENICAALASAASSTSCSLKELDLSNNLLQDAGAQHLLDLLKHPTCKLEKLELMRCSLTEKSCATLASAASSTSCSLKELNLSGNEIQDAGAQHLSDLLKNPHSKLKKLVLCRCSLTEKSCAVLASAASSPSCCLTELNLSRNSLSDAGVHHLSDLLKYSHCKLEALLLYGCSLTEKTCSDLASAVNSICCSLIELNLSENELHDAGFQHLTDLLKNPHCKLEKLVLEGCFLSKKSCAALASAASLTTSCSLKELNLTDNEIHDAGVQHLSDLLRNPHCKLEKLQLSWCSLTKNSCAALASSAISTSCCLKELILSGNKIYDAGVQHLSELLMNPHCKLEKLELVSCNLRVRTCDALASAVSLTSCSLKELDMTDNELPYAGVQHLSDLLKNPHCNLEKLEVKGFTFRKESLC